MILTHEAQESDKSAVSTMLAADQSLDAGADASTDIDSPSFLEDVYECERLLNAVWPSNVALSHEVPRQFGRFSIVRELGRGGFGIVFLAEDLQLRRLVALKVPRPEVMVTADFRRRFLREAEAASRLGHPHIVPVYEVGEEGPFCFIVSAYCEGPTLAQWLRGQTSPVPIPVAARLVAVLAAAVAHAHDRDILHRDLKPGNILLERREASASPSEGADQGLGFVPRICDFGLAKLLDQTSHETCSGVPIGSASYMAPEQAAGRLREHGPATDVYALGAILFELSTGRPPFRGETDLETISLVNGQEPPSPRALRPGLPRDLETITLKCLEKRPIRRYASASELTDDVRRFLDGKAVHARPLPAWGHAGRWVKRRPIHATLSLVVVLAMSSIAGMMFWSGAWLRWHRQDKEAAVSLAERETQRFERSMTEARIIKARADESRRSAQLSDRFVFNRQVRLLHETLESRNFGLAAAMMEDYRSTSEVDGFALRYVRQLFRPALSRLGEAAIGGPAVLKMAISPDDRTLAAGTSDGRVVIWDLVGEKVRQTLVHGTGPELEVYSLNFSRDGRYLATVCPPNSVKIWDMTTLTERATLPANVNGTRAHVSGVFEVQFTDRADCVATFAQGWRDGKFQVWFWSVPAPGGQPELREIVDKTQLPSFGAEGPLKDPAWPRSREATAPWLSYARNHLVVLEDGVTFAIKDGPTEATLYDHYNHRPVARIRGPLNIPAIRQRMFTSLSPREIEQLRRQARRVVGSEDVLEPGTIPTPLFDIAELSPDGRTMAVHLANKYLGGFAVALIDVASNRTLLTNAPALWRVTDLAFTADGRTLVIAGFDSQIHLWHLKPNALAGHKQEIWSLAFSPDGNSIASAADDSTVKLWDIAGGRERATLSGHGSLVTTLAYAPNGTLIVSAGFDQTIRLWDAATGENKGIFRGHTGRVRALAFRPDGKMLASAGDDRVIRLWNVDTGSELRAPLSGHSDSVFSLVFAPDGKTLYSGASDKTVRLWDPEQGRLIQTWIAGEQVYCLAVSPDGRTLAAGHYRLGTVTLWDVISETARPSMKCHDGDVLGIAFSPDGLTLATAGRDQLVRLWDPVTAQELLTLKGHSAPVHAVAFSPDGMNLASGSHDGAIRLWRAPRTPSQ